MKNNRDFNLNQYQLNEITHKQLVEINGGGLGAYLIGWGIAIGSALGYYSQNMRDADRASGYPLANKF